MLHSGVITLVLVWISSAAFGEVSVGDRMSLEEARIEDGTCSCCLYSIDQVSLGDRGAGDCKRLKLVLRGQKIRRISDLSSPQNVGLRDKVVHLDLGNNNLETLSGISYFSKLEFLDVSDNAIAGFDAIASLDRLKEVRISGNHSTIVPVDFEEAIKYRNFALFRALFDEVKFDVGNLSLWGYQSPLRPFHIEQSNPPDLATFVDDLFEYALECGDPFIARYIWQNAGPGQVKFRSTYPIYDQEKSSVLLAVYYASEVTQLIYDQYIRHGIAKFECNRARSLDSNFGRTEFGVQSFCNIRGQQAKANFPTVEESVLEYLSQSNVPPYKPNDLQRFKNFLVEQMQRRYYTFDAEGVERLLAQWTNQLQKLQDAGIPLSVRSGL